MTTEDLKLKIQSIAEDIDLAELSIDEVEMILVISKRLDANVMANEQMRDISIDMIREYFAKLPKYRGKFYSQMRVEATRFLMKKKYSKVDIAEIVYCNRSRHDTVYHNVRRTDIVDVDEVRTNWKSWIEQGLYPITKHVHMKRIAESDRHLCLANADLEYGSLVCVLTLEKL